MIVQRITVTNPLGLHARAAAKFVQVASQFDCTVRVSVGDRTMDGKSILGLLLLAAARGAELTMVTDGPDEAAASEELVALAVRGFDVA